MKNKIMLTLMSIILVVTMLNFVNAELWLWDNTIIDTNNSIVRFHAYYQVEDTSDSLITITKPIPVELVGSVQDLPYNISATLPQYPNALVDWCNYTIQVQRNIYDTSLGITNYNIINTTLETYNVFFQNTNATFNVTQWNLKHRDGIIADMDCHYTNPDTLFIENVYFGIITTYVPAFECKGCGMNTFEELTQTNLNLEEQIREGSDIYPKIQGVVEKNYQVWLIASWFLKIGLIFVAVALIFVGFYYLYIFFKNLEIKSR